MSSCTKSNTVPASVCEIRVIAFLLSRTLLAIAASRLDVAVTLITAAQAIVEQLPEHSAERPHACRLIMSIAAVGFDVQTAIEHGAVRS